MSYSEAKAKYAALGVDCDKAFLLQTAAEGGVMLLPVLAGAEDVAAHTGKDFLQLATGIAVPLKKFRADVDDDALIGYTWLKFRTVDAVGTHQHHVARLQDIPLAVDHIAAPAGPEQQKFAEIVIMIVHFCALGII